MKLTKNDLNLTNAVAKEASRPVLGYVLLRKGKLVAADGFILVGRQADLEENERMAGQDEVLLPPNILKLARAEKKETTEIFLEDDGTMKLVVKNTKGEVKDPTLSFKRPQGVMSFPPYNGALPKTEKLAYTAINLKKLRKLLTSLPEDGVLRLKIAQPSEPIECYVGDAVEGRPIRAFIMPTYVSWTDHKWAKDDPNWVTKEVTKEEGGDGSGDNINGGQSEHTPRGQETG